jgi:FkbM family methyltransferase
METIFGMTNFFVEKPVGIIQIGANDGGEIPVFNQHTQNQIYFEPVKEARDTLVSKLADDPQLNISKFVFPYIISNETASVDFFLGREHGNSSLFDLNPVRSDQHLHNIHDTKITLPSITLDEFFIKHSSEVNMEDYDYLFMDVQGAEHLVVEGSSELLKYIKYIYMEVSYEEIYLGTMLFEDMVIFMKDKGFSVLEHKVSPYNYNQGDCLFIKDSIEKHDHE